MAALADIFALARIKLDDGSFQAEAIAAATKAGNSAGTKMSQSLNSKLRAGLKTAFTTGAGALFGIATQQAAALDTATQKLIADTGLVGDAADQAKGQLAGLYRGNLQGFDQISAALAKVHTDLGLTGTAAGDTTGLFLKFSTATGQDAAEAVAQADDTLDAFNLTAADAGPLLDKLIVSHQKYGGSINESEAALSKMAPALTSFGLGLDDGIGLLNLFNAAGVDASKVPTALAKALKAVKSPAEFKALLNDIKNTKDPFEQAQKAIALFGAKAGPQLAQALRQGNLDDFIVTMDEARGATNKAADAVESGWGARFQLIMHNVGGALAEFGQNFGPLLMVGAQLGPKLASSIGAGLGGLASIIGPKLAAAFAGLLPAAAASGTAQGVAMGGAAASATIATELGAEVAGTVAAAELPVAVAAHTGIGTAAGTAAAAAEVATEAAGVTAGQAVVAAEAIPAAAVAGTSIGTAMGAAVAAVLRFAIPAAIVVALAASADEIQKFLGSDYAHNLDLPLNQWSWPFGPKNTPKVDIGPFKNILGGDSSVVFDPHANVKMGSELFGPPTPGSGGVSGLGNAALAAAALTSTATTLDKIHGDFRDAVAALRHASTPAAIAAAVARLVKDVRGGVGNAKQTAALVADLTTRRDAALKSGDKALADTLSAEIRKISPLVAGRAHQAALLVQGAKIVASSESAKQKVAALAVIENELKALHRTTAAAAIQKQIDILNAVNRTTAAVKGIGDFGAPHPGSTNAGSAGGVPQPLPGTKTPPAVSLQPGHHLAAGGLFRPRQPMIVGELRPELLIPDVGGRIVPQVASGATGGNTYNVAVQGLIRARDPFEVATQLRRLASFGVVTPRVASG